LTVREARRLTTLASFSVGPPPRARRDGDKDVVLEARSLSASFADRTVVRDVDLTLHAGEIVALMGRNGAGKTTLLRCLCGLHAPASGRVLATGRTPRPGRDVALCPQTPESILFRDRVVSEVETTLAATHGSRDPAELLDALGIGDLAPRHPRDLSAGERLVVAVAAIVATGAPVLLLDEPTRGLDPDAKARLTELLRAHTGGTNAAVFATHDVELVAELATRVVMLAGGEVIADGDPADVLGDSPVFAPQMARVFGPGWLTPDQVASALGIAR
jgi:energy-coupling factor transport system ATP-binding protein